MAQEEFKDLMKQPNYSISNDLRKYLKYYGRKVNSDLEYDDLLRF
jgi:hypothetical protein